jgi:hypothetical protein
LPVVLGVLSVADHRFRLDLVRGRCTGFAEELLRELECHPHFTDLLGRLTALAGPITRSDIERVFLELRKSGSD